MTQIRHMQWKDTDSTYNMNIRFNGIIPAGVYAGFIKTAPMINSNVLRLNPSRYEYAVDGSRYQVSIVVSPQMVIIKETEPINLSISPNTASVPRIDTVICQSQYTEVDGGLAAVYLVKEGAPAANPIAPGIDVPLSQVIVGTVLVPPNYTTGDLTWTVAPKPTFAYDAEAVKLSNNNWFTGANIFRNINQQKTVVQVVGSALRPTDDAYRDLNAYVLPAGNGSRQTINTITLTSSAIATWQAKDIYIACLRPLLIQNTGNILFPANMTELSVDANSIIRLINVSEIQTAKTWLIDVVNTVPRNSAGNYLPDGNIQMDNYRLAKTTGIHNLNVNTQRTELVPAIDFIHPNGAGRVQINVKNDSETSFISILGSVISNILLTCRNGVVNLANVVLNLTSTNTTINSTGQHIFNGTNTLIGTNTLTGTTNAQTLNVDTLRIQGQVTGNATFENDVAINGRLDVNDAMSVNSTLEVDGLNVDGNVIVTGSSQFTANGVNTTSFNGNTNINGINVLSGSTQIQDRYVNTSNNANVDIMGTVNLRATGNVNNIRIDNTNTIRFNNVDNADLPRMLMGLTNTNSLPLIVMRETRTGLGNIQLSLTPNLLAVYVDDVMFFSFSYDGGGFSFNPDYIPTSDTGLSRGRIYRTGTALQIKL